MYENDYIFKNYNFLKVYLWMNQLCFVKNYSITFYNNFWNTKDCQRSYDFPSFEFLENVSIFDIDWKYILGHGYLQKYNAVLHLLLCYSLFSVSVFHLFIHFWIKAISLSFWILNDILFGITTDANKSFHIRIFHLPCK